MSKKKLFNKKTLKGDESPLNYRAGTDLTYNRRRGEGVISRTIEDIAYIRYEDNFYTAISLKTGLTALGESPEDAYSCLIFKLFDSLREVVESSWASSYPVEELKQTQPRSKLCHNWIPQRTSNRYKN